MRKFAIIIIKLKARYPKLTNVAIRLPGELAIFFSITCSTYSWQVTGYEMQFAHS